jgi:adenine-specific DNA-methyltransferase
MDKLKMQTANKADENFKKLAALFPNAVTETINENGEVVRAIDKDVLMQEISCTVVDGKEERYQFTWPDKKKSVLLANAPINKTLRPCREESVDFDTTENLYIEGDNLEVLKLLQETYLGKVKMIYIDPPYNTGNDFVYEDDFAQSMDEYLANSGQYDEDGNRMVQNTESNGRFHTDWLNMIYPRLKLAKDLLTDDGVIFISIDDNEQENLKKCCDEVFDGQNFVAQLVWERAFSPKNDARFVSNSHDYVLMYAKDITQFVIGRLPRTEEANARYSNPDNDPRGVWMSSDISVKTYNAECDYPITAPSGRVIEPPAGRCWSLSKKAFLERLQDNRIWFGPDGNGVPRIKRFLTDLKHEGMAPTSIMFFKDVGHSQEGAQEVSKLLDGGFFSGPKPQRLMQRLLTLANLKSDSVVLDFFSGSASTAHAVMSKNAEDGGHRKFIMVQLPEVTDKKSEAYKAGYKNICEIGKERIRRAGKKIKEDNPLTAQNLDIGFRVLKCDTTNMKDVYYNPADYKFSMLSAFEDNIKEDRTPEDLLFQVMLDLGVLLSSKIEETTIAGKKVFNVEDNYLIACFDSNVTDETIKAIAMQKPYYFVMRDSSMANDSVATNFDQIFATYSPDTVRKVL